VSPTYGGIKDISHQCRFSQKYSSSLWRATVGHLSDPRCRLKNWPTSRNFLATVASFGTTLLSSAYEPAVVFMPSSTRVAMLSLSRIGIPCSRPRTLPYSHSTSSRAACESAVGLISVIARSAAPRTFTSSIRAKYACTVGQRDRRSEEQSSRCVRGRDQR